MADKKISELAPGGGLDGSELVPVVQTGATKRVTAQAIADLAASGGGTVTSVGLTVPPFMSVAGSPIDDAGTLVVTYSGTALPVANGGTGLTSFGTGITSFGAGVATWLGTPSSANLAAAVTDETGSGALVFGTSPTLTTPALGTPSALVLTNATGAVGANFGTKTANYVFAGPTSGGAANPDFRALVAADISGLQGTGLGALDVGFRLIPQNSRSAAYTTTAGDSGQHIFHPAADTTARTFTIDSNANVAYPIGTAITFINEHGAGVITIAINSDTMRQAGTGATGSRTLAADGVATAIKITSTGWIISGTGLT